MKKISTLLSTILLMAGVAMAQSVTTPSQSLKLQYKGAQAVGNDIELTVLLTNLSSQEVIVNLVGGVYQTGMSGSVVYDSEGNVYELGSVLVSVGNKSYTEQYCAGNFPSGVPVKCHILVRGVAGEATSFAKVKLCLLCQQLDIQNTGVCFEMNNLPIR